MNIVNIMLKEVKQIFRDRQSMALMVAFPIVLILILGSALSGAFKSSINLDDVNILYTSESGKISEGFNAFMDSAKEMEIKFTESKDFNNGLEKIKDADYTCYVALRNDGLTLYKNERYDFKANLVEGILQTFIDRYNVIFQIATVNPSALSKIDLNKTSESVKMISLEGNRQPRAVDYYSVTMTTLIIMYAAGYGIWCINSERVLKTGNRMLSSPVRKHEILIAKLTGGVFATSLQILIVFIVSKYVIGAYWGNHIVIVLLILLSQIIMIISMGAGMSFVVKNEVAASSLVNTLIPFLVFLGGGYVPLEQFGSKTLLNIAKISPVRWANDSIFEAVFANSTSKAGYAIALNLGVAAIFIIFSSILFRKEEVI